MHRNIIIQSVSLQHNALLVRNLKYKNIAAITFFANLLSILIAFLLALNGVKLLGVSNKTFSL